MGRTFEEVEEYFIARLSPFIRLTANKVLMAEASKAMARRDSKLENKLPSFESRVAKQFKNETLFTVESHYKDQLGTSGGPLYKLSRFNPINLQYI